MIPSLWNDTVFGGVAMTTEDSIVTAPRFGDGNWRGGWWARYDRQTGTCKWRREHRRGAELFDRIGDIVFATTHKYSGIYAISLASGRRVWARLGDRFDWMLKCFEMLPCDNEGDAPERVWNGRMLTRSGRLLDAATGRIVSRHQLEYSNDNPRTLIKIDEKLVSPAGALRARESFDLHKQEEGPVEALLARNGLGLAGTHPCVIRAHGLCVCLACKPPGKFLEEPRSRLHVGGSKDEVPHFLVVSDSESSTIIEQFDLGTFYTGEIDWADESILSVTTQTLRQWNWSYQRQMWLLEWRTLMKMLTMR
jgi:hypothetical protein